MTKLEDIGKRMPYMMPEGYLESVKNKKAWQKPSREPYALRFLWISIAASIFAALCVTSIVRMLKPNEPADDFTDIASTFERLDEDDQTFLLDAYSEDIYLSQL